MFLSSNNATTKVALLLDRQALSTLEQRGSDRTTTTYVYDHRSRVLSEHKTLNNAPPVDIIYRYDDLGVLVGRNIDGIEEQMTYDIQGALTAKTVCNADGDELFSTDLRYYSPRHASTTPTYSGNITEWDWRFGASDMGNTYAFEYDALSRLTTTTQYIDGIHDDRFVEKGLTYDLNSNILSLQRTSGGTLSDKLAYTYTGNRLASLSGTTSANYSYDANGNLTHDGANNLDLTYNYLNLIEKVSSNGTVLANYSYLSDGRNSPQRTPQAMGLFIGVLWHIASRVTPFFSRASRSAAVGLCLRRWVWNLATTSPTTWAASVSS